MKAAAKGYDPKSNFTDSFKLGSKLGYSCHMEHNLGVTLGWSLPMYFGVACGNIAKNSFFFFFFIRLLQVTPDLPEVQKIHRKNIYNMILYR